MSNIIISIGCTADRDIRKIDLAQAHSIIIAGGSESLRNALVCSIQADLEAAAVDAAYVDSKGLSRIDEEVTAIETFAREVDERLINLTPESEEKVLIVSDYADYALAPGKEGRSFASRVRESIEHIAIKGKAVGMHVILVVGRPCVDVLTIRLKKCFPTIICFKTLTGADSFAVINMRKACEIESNQLVLCQEYEYEVLNVLPCERD
mgnify:CR=1 FL=1